jgi:hypothetical protein
MVPLVFPPVLWPFVPPVLSWEEELITFFIFLIKYIYLL